MYTENTKHIERSSYSRIDQALLIHLILISLSYILISSSSHPHLIRANLFYMNSTNKWSLICSDVNKNWTPKDIDKD